MNRHLLFCYAVLLVGLVLLWLAGQHDMATGGAIGMVIVLFFTRTPSEAETPVSKSPNTDGEE